MIYGTPPLPFGWRTASHPKVVAELLGHASVTLTLDTYSHVLPGMQEQATERLDALLLDAKATRRAKQVGSAP